MLVYSVLPAPGFASPGDRSADEQRPHQLCRAKELPGQIQNTQLTFGRGLFGSNSNRLRWAVRSGQFIWLRSLALRVLPRSTRLHVRPIASLREVRIFKPARGIDTGLRELLES